MQGLTLNLLKDANYYLQKCFWALRAVQILFWLTVRCLMSPEIFLICSDSIFNLIKSSSLLLNHQTLVLQYRLKHAWLLKNKRRNKRLQNLLDRSNKKIFTWIMLFCWLIICSRCWSLPNRLLSPTSCISLLVVWQLLWPSKSILLVLHQDLLVMCRWELVVGLVSQAR